MKRRILAATVVIVVVVALVAALLLGRTGGGAGRSVSAPLPGSRAAACPSKGPLGPQSTALAAAWALSGLPYTSPLDAPIQPWLRATGVHDAIGAAAELAPGDNSTGALIANLPTFLRQGGFEGHRLALGVGLRPGVTMQFDESPLAHPDTYIVYWRIGIRGTTEAWPFPVVVSVACRLDHWRLAALSLQSSPAPLADNPPLPPAPACSADPRSWITVIGSAWFDGYSINQALPTSVRGIVSSAQSPVQAGRVGLPSEVIEEYQGPTPPPGPPQAIATPMMAGTWEVTASTWQIPGGSRAAFVLACADGHWQVQAIAVMRGAPDSYLVEAPS